MTYMSSGERRARLVEAAVLVIAEVGVSAATTRKIAERAESPLAAVHYCFGSKANLLSAVQRHLTTTGLADISESEADAPTLAEAATGILTAAMRSVVESPERTRATIAISSWANRHDPALAVRLADDFISRWQSQLARSAPELAADQLESTTRLLVALADGLVEQWRVYDNAERLLHDTERACEMVEAYLSSPEASACSADRARDR
ncbi:TetR family transcriptional regulator [Pseudonocardia sp. C8]|uniref:TetR/AcrR family transcriptional regulator n=1 Tax=Pseudonocardia sp. C8 TaxID=2762759 RepID=UPI00164296AC|nr:TetR family transcriptional regulator [Pseudonocardia sp. C8]MBC3189959.1 TetR family transcriptional regulator [Pseudonocardia sp. C8]